MYFLLEVASPARAQSPIGLWASVCRALSGLANPTLLSLCYQQFKILCKIISFHFISPRKNEFNT